MHGLVCACGMGWYLPGAVFVSGGDADEVDGQRVGEAGLVQGLGVTEPIGRGRGGSGGCC